MQVKYKIGDRVRVVKFKCNNLSATPYVGYKGIVSQIHEDRKDMPYCVELDKFPNKGTWPYNENELELLIKLGEQLQFEFMKESKNG